MIKKYSPELIQSHQMKHQEIVQKVNIIPINPSKSSFRANTIQKQNIVDNFLRYEEKKQISDPLRHFYSKQYEEYWRSKIV